MFKKILFISLGVIVALIAGFIIIGFVKPTCHTANSVTVNAPASHAFAVFNDTANMRFWMDNFKRVENISGENDRVGSKWKLVFDEHGSDLVMVETITAYEEGKLFAFELDDEFANFQIVVRFDEVNGQTIISQTSDGEGKNMAARSMIALMRGMMEKQQIEMYNRLKELIEKTK
jgi:uncharacterized membrane protein